MPYLFSDALDDQLLYERMRSFRGGMDNFTTPTELPPNVSQYFENIILRDAQRPRTRPGAATLDAAPAADEPGGPHHIQGLFYFDTPSKEQLIAASAGKLWIWEGAAWTEVDGYTLTDADLRAEIAQGIDLALITDGTAQMRTWDGTNISAALGNTTGTVTSDPPVGATILCWHTARMFASGMASAPDTILASFLLEFGAGKWNHVNFSFRVGGGEGNPIVGLASIKGFNLVVLKEHSVHLVNADPAAASAADWPIDDLSKAIGCVGKEAWCAYGNEVLFMAQDGVRSVRQAAATEGQYEIAPPLSLPVQPFIDRINKAYAHLIVAQNYKELVLFAVPLDNATNNDTVLVYNARLGAWCGVWTGWTPACWEISRFGKVERLVLGEQTGLVRQWKDFEDPDDDATQTDDGDPIPTKVWTRATEFQEPESDKDGHHSEVRFNPSNAIVTITAVADDVDLRTWEKDVRPTGPTLPVDLPFDLVDLRPSPKRRGLRGLAPFNELFLKIESTTGWWELRNITLTAFLNSLKSE